MKTYPSETANGGTTYILDNQEQAIDMGKQAVESALATYKDQADANPTGKVQVSETDRESGKTKSKTLKWSTFVDQYSEYVKRYEICVNAIRSGNPQLNERIAELADQLKDMALEIQPSLACGYKGWERNEEGVTAAPELLAQGDPVSCWRRRRSGDEAKPGRGEGAYRIIINTDVAWWGEPDMNAVVMGALVMVLQNFAPVEIYIQQGWLGHSSSDGVTLFKLDYEGAFEPTQLFFWCGHELKDYCFSYFVSRACGRNNSRTSTVAELEADLYMRGDWMTLYGISDKRGFAKMTHFERMDIMAKWIADTAFKIVFKPDIQV